MTGTSVPVILKRVLLSDDGAPAATYFHVSTQGAEVVDEPVANTPVVTLTFNRALALELIAERTTLAEAFNAGSVKFSGDLRAISNLSTLLNELSHTHSTVFAVSPHE